MSAHEAGKIFEFSYIHFIDDKQHDTFLKELSALEGVSNIYQLNATNDVDY